MSDRNSKRAGKGRTAGRLGPVWVLGFTLALGTTAAPAQEEQPSGSGAPAVAAQEEPLTQYRAFRRMHARSERFNQEGWLEAWTELDGKHFRYQIVSERGSEYVRNKVLKGILKKEQQIIAEGDPQRAALTEQNYEFGHTAEGADGLRYVLIKPRRKEVTLVDGRMVLSPDGNELLRVEGRLAKNPSFWTSLVNVIRTFAKVDGVRVPVSTESIAKVKFAGQSRLEVSYQYESINGRPVSIAARRVLASAVSTTR